MNSGNELRIFIEIRYSWICSQFERDGWKDYCSCVYGGWKKSFIFNTRICMTTRLITHFFRPRSILLHIGDSNKLNSCSILKVKLMFYWDKTKIKLSRYQCLSRIQNKKEWTDGKYLNFAVITILECLELL